MMSFVFNPARKVVRFIYNRFFRSLVAEQIRAWYIEQPRLFGPPNRLKVAATAKVMNGYFNLVCGTVEVEEYVFFGNNVSVITGTHDYQVQDLARQDAIPESGRDVIIGRGAWIGSNAVILGPCRIGDHAVVAAGSVVTRDVPPCTIVAGIPARVIRKIEFAKTGN